MNHDQLVEHYKANHKHIEDGAAIRRSLLINAGRLAESLEKGTDEWKECLARLLTDVLADYLSCEFLGTDEWFLGTDEWNDDLSMKEDSVEKTLCELIDDGTIPDLLGLCEQLGCTKQDLISFYLALPTNNG